MQIYTHYKRPKTRFKVFKKPSLAVPDQTMSLKVMVTKYVKGLPISAPNLDGIYTDEDDAIDFNKLDLAEQEQLILNASEELSETKGRITRQREEDEANAKKIAENQENELQNLKKQLAELKH